MGVEVNLTGSGSIGPVLPGWGVREDITPVILGDSSGGVGQVNVSAGRGLDTEFAYENDSTLVHPSLGEVKGQVMDISSSGSSEPLSVKVDMILSTPLGKLSTNRTASAVGGPTMARAGVQQMTAAQSFGDRRASEVSSYIGSQSKHYLYFDAVTADTFYIQKVTTANEVTTLTVNVAGIGFGPSFGMVMDSLGNYYVGLQVSGAPRVYKISPAGAVLLSWGGTGSGNGQFGAAFAGNGNPLAYDGSLGRIYVADYSNNRVQIFDLNGSYISQFSSQYVYNVTMWPGGIMTASYDGTYRRFTQAGALLVQSKYSGRLSGENIGLSMSSDGNYLLALVAVRTGNGYSIVRIDPETLAEVQTWRYADQYATRFDVALDFVTVLGASVTFGVVPVIERFIYSRTTLFGAIAYYMALAGVDVLSFDTVMSNPYVVFPGWSGNVWDMLKQLCAVYSIEIAVVNGVPYVRKAGLVTFDLTGRVQEDSVELSIGSPTARSVSISYTNAVIDNGGTGPNGYDGTLYNAKKTGEIFTVDVGQTVFQTVTTTNYPAIINKPTPGNPYFDGIYGVVDSSNPAIAIGAETWLFYGGDISVGQNPDTMTSLDVTITGPSTTIPGTQAPYRIAATVSGTNVLTPALSVTGRGVFTDPEEIDLLTGASVKRTVSEAAGDIDNPFVNTLTQAYDRGVWASSMAGGPTVRLRANVATNSLAGFGLTNGSIVTFKENKYRINSINYRDTWATIEADRSASMQDFKSSLGASQITRVNLVTNPSVESGGALTAQGYNLLSNPSGRRTLTGYVVAGGSIGQDAGQDTYVFSTSAGGPGTKWIRFGTMIVGSDFAANTTYTVSVDVLTQGQAIAPIMYAEGPGVVGGAAPPLNFPATAGVWTRGSITFTTAASGAVYFNIYNGATITAATYIIAFRDAIVNIGTAAYTYFDGYTVNPSDDFANSWLGTPDNSPSVRSAFSAVNYAGGVAWVFRSALWSESRSHALRVISTYNLPGSAFAEVQGVLTAPAAAGKTYTIMATAYVPVNRSRPPSINVVDRVGAGAYRNQNVLAPSANAGTYPLRLTFSVLAGATELYIRLYSNVVQGEADVWFDNILLVEGTYTGPYFDGFGPGLASWDGITDASTSRQITSNKNISNLMAVWPANQISDFTIKPLRPIA